MNKQEKLLLYIVVLFFCLLLSLLHSEEYVQISKQTWQLLQMTKQNLLNQTEYLLNLLTVLNKNLETGMPESNEIKELLILYNQISENQRLIIENQKKIDENSMKQTNDLQNSNEKSEIENQKEIELLQKLKTELKISRKILKKYQRRRWIERIILLGGIVSAYFLGKKLDMILLS